MIAVGITTIVTAMTMAEPTGIATVMMTVTSRGVATAIIAAMPMPGTMTVLSTIPAAPRVAPGPCWVRWAVAWRDIWSQDAATS